MFAQYITYITHNPPGLNNVAQSNFENAGPAHCETNKQASYAS